MKYRRQLSFISKNGFIIIGFFSFFLDIGGVFETTLFFNLTLSNCIFDVLCF